MNHKLLALLSPLFLLGCPDGEATSGKQNSFNREYSDNIHLFNEVVSEVTKPIMKYLLDDIKAHPHESTSSRETLKLWVCFVNPSAAKVPYKIPEHILQAAPPFSEEECDRKVAQLKEENKEKPLIETLINTIYNAVPQEAQQYAMETAFENLYDMTQPETSVTFNALNKPVEPRIKLTFALHTLLGSFPNIDVKLRNLENVEYNKEYMSLTHNYYFKVPSLDNLEDGEIDITIRLNNDETFNQVIPVPTSKKELLTHIKCEEHRRAALAYQEISYSEYRYLRVSSQIIDVKAKIDDKEREKACTETNLKKLGGSKNIYQECDALRQHSLDAGKISHSKYLSLEKEHMIPIYDINDKPSFTMACDIK